MTITTSFRYEKPGTITQAIELLAEAGSKGRVLAGGTDLVGWLKDGLVVPDLLVDIKGIDTLRELSLDHGRLSIGALVTVADMLKSDMIRDLFPLFKEMAGMLACTGIRNRATVVGNISSAVPCCDNGPVLLVYDAVIHAASVSGQRDIPMTHWFLGPRRTALQPGELVTGISVPLPNGKNAGCFVKQKRYKGEDLAQSSVAILALESREYRIAFGSVAPTPVRAPKIESLLAGQPLTPDCLQEACRLIPEETAPITDIRSTKEYRAHMLTVMLRRGLETAVARLAGNGPDYGVNVIE